MSKSHRSATPKKGADKDAPNQKRGHYAAALWRGESCVAEDGWRAIECGLTLYLGMLVVIALVAWRIAGHVGWSAETCWYCGEGDAVGTPTLDSLATNWLQSDF